MAKENTQLLRQEHTTKELLRQLLNAVQYQENNLACFNELLDDIDSIKHLKEIKANLSLLRDKITLNRKLIENLFKYSELIFKTSDVASTSVSLIEDASFREDSCDEDLKGKRLVYASKGDTAQQEPAASEPTILGVAERSKNIKRSSKTPLPKPKVAKLNIVPQLQSSHGVKLKPAKASQAFKQTNNPVSIPRVQAPMLYSAPPRVNQAPFGARSPPYMPTLNPYFNQYVYHPHYGYLCYYHNQASNMNPYVYTY